MPWWWLHAPPPPSHHAYDVASLVPSVCRRRKEHLVSAICACMKLIIFIAPLFCIMTQPYLLFSINTSSRSITEKKVKQSPQGHFSMASSDCILNLCRLCVRPRLMRTRHHYHCKWPLRWRIPKSKHVSLYIRKHVSKICFQTYLFPSKHVSKICIIQTWKNTKNNTVSQISGKISRMHKQLKPGVLSSTREHQVWGYYLLYFTAYMQASNSSKSSCSLCTQAEQ